MAVGTYTDQKKSRRSKGQHFDKELFPGIPNDITLELITPKLPWRTLPVLSRVSRGWEEAIRTKQVYEARVRANSTETLIVHPHSHDVDGQTLALYSTIEKCCFELPSIPSLPKGILRTHDCIAVDGKLYVLGGTQIVRGDRSLEAWRLQGGFKRDEVIPRGEVHVLDLAGVRGKWERCASMLEPRSGFRCGVMDGKIYIFGGGEISNSWKRIFSSRCDVYDIKNNSWSPIMPMIRTSSDYKHAVVATVENELFLDYTDNSRMETSAFGVYNPGKDEWRWVERFWEEHHSWSQVFIKKGKFYMLSRSGIDVYNVERNSWINRHSNSFAAVLPVDPPKLYPVEVMPVKDELVFSASYYIGRDHYFQSFQCIGFDSLKKEMVWQKTNCSFTPNVLGFFHCSIQL